MSLRWLIHVPFLNCLLSFTGRDHKRALEKFLILWGLSSLPILWSIVFSRIPDINQPIWPQLADRFDDAISISELFVYAASYLAPVFYMIFERYQDFDINGSFGERVKETLKGVFSGYKLVFFLALVVLILTASTYSAAKTNPSEFKTTFVHWFAAEGVLGLYIYAVFCWYLTILDATRGGVDFVERNRASEDDLSLGLSGRIAKGSAQK